MTRLFLILTVLCAGCAATGEPLIQAGGKNSPMIQAGSTTQPVVGDGAFRMTLNPTTNLNMQLGSKDGPLVTLPLTVTVGKDAFNFNLNVPQGAVQLTTQVTVPMPDLTYPALALGGLVLLAMIIHVVFTHVLAKRRGKA